MRKMLTAIVIFSIIVVGGYLLIRRSAPSVSSLEGAEAVQPSLAVEAVMVTRGNLKQTTGIAVSFAPTSTVPVLPKVAGTVLQVMVKTGDPVSKNQTLFTIDDTQLKLQVKQAEAAYEMACANLRQAEKGASPEELKQIESAFHQAKASYENVEAESERVAALYAQEMITKQQLEAVQLQLKLATANLAAAEARLSAARKGASTEQLQILKAQVKQAQTALDLANLQLSYSRVTAPIAGVVAQLNVEVGSPAAPTTAAVVLIDDRQMTAKALVSETYVNYLQPGKEVRIEAKALPENTLTGTVTSVSPLADQTNRQFPVEFSVANPSQSLKAGMMGVAYVVVGEVTDRPLLPVSAVLYDGEQPYVYLVEAGQAVRRDIELGLTTSDQVAVEAGLDGGEQVIIKGQYQVKNGMLVEVK